MMIVKEHCVLNIVCGDTTPVCGALKDPGAPRNKQCRGENEAAEEKAKSCFKFIESKGTKPSSDWL